MKARARLFNRIPFHMLAMALSIFLLFGGLMSCANHVQFETTVDKTQLTKDGCYMENYVVHVEENRVLELDGTRVVVRGKCTYMKGVNSSDGEIVQGREGESKHILHPKIKVIEP